MALPRLIEVVYDELRRVAARHLVKERLHDRLQPTELVHEAFCRLVQDEPTLQNRAHFFAVASKVMRRVLVDHARKRSATKRGGGEEHVPFFDNEAGGAPKSVRVLDLDCAMTELEYQHPRQSRIVELRFFGGLGVTETAEILKLSPRTVKREWQDAKTFLEQRLA